MSIAPENEFDLEKLFLPAWAQEPSSARQYAKYEGGEQRSDRRDDQRGPRPPRRDGPPGGGGRRGENRPRGDARGPARPGGAGRRPFGADRPAFDRGEQRERREPPPPLPEIELAFIPDEKGVESLARQIKMTGRAYPLFDIAQMILQKPERHGVVFTVKKNAEGQPNQRLVLCALDDTLWLSEDEAIAHILKKHFATFYVAERTATEPPKGKYTFVAQCGVSGVVLGPPNYHDYQNQLRKLHAERFSRMPFEMFKSRVKIVKDEEVVKKWIDDQSWKTDYVCLNLPEPLRLDSMEAVEKHFREAHKDNIIKTVESHTLTGTAARALRSPELARLIRSVWEDQRRFPLQIATVLSQQFAGQGLQFFKVNKTITHVSVARPHHLDMEATPVSEGVKRIVDYINTHPKCNRRKLMEVLAPAGAETASATGQPPAPPANAEPTPEQTAVISDLHWLIHQGHVIEFANGNLETAKKPLPRPARPEPKRTEKPAATAPRTESVAAADGPGLGPNGEPAPVPTESVRSEESSSPEKETAPHEAPASEASPIVAGETPVESAVVPVEQS